MFFRYLPKSRFVCLILVFVSLTSLNAATYYVNTTTGSDAWDGLSAESLGGNVGPKATIQAAVDVAVDGDTILVAPGTYTGSGNQDIDISNKAIILQSETGPADCIVDADGSSSEHHRAFLLAANCTLDGFTIQNGYANSGGGIYISASDPIIANCILTANHANGSGGGLACVNANPTLADCEFTYNTATSGGGIYISEGDLQITDSRIINNDVLGSETGMYYLGGGICCESDSSLTMESVRIAGNYAGSFGGGIFIDDSDLTAVNCLFTGNWANVYGGGIYHQNGIAAITNCTIAHNRAVTWGGGLRLYLGCNAALNNCIIWGNLAYGQATSSQIALAETAMLNVASCNVQGGQDIYREAGSVLNWAAGNVSVNPGFVRAGRQDPDSGGEQSADNWSWIEGDYRLLTDSPCIDSGDNLAVSEYDMDINDNRRVSNGVVDLGPYENGLLISRFFVKAARVGRDLIRPANQDMFMIMGEFDATEEDFNHDQMTIRLGLIDGTFETTVDMTSSEFFAHPKAPMFLYKNKIRPGDPGGVSMMKLDVGRGTFLIMAQYVDLTGMSGTVPFEIDIGNGAYAVTGIAGEDIVNAGSPAPMELLYGAADSIQVTKYKVKRIPHLSGRDFLMVSGGISVEDTQRVLSGKKVTFKWGTFEAVIPAGNKGLALKGTSYFYKKPRDLVNGDTVYADMAMFDFTRSMFLMMVKNTDIGSQSGTVPFSISFEEFDQTAEVQVD